MSTPSGPVRDHYEQSDLVSRVLSALTAAGATVEALTLDDISALDQFHLGGRTATRRLCRLAGIRDAMHVLDIGSGLGGPARVMASEFGCSVTGIDLTRAFCDVAAELTERVGLADRVAFRHGDAMEIPFDRESFDVVWAQHVFMNIECKERLLVQVGRVLRPGGLLALHEIMEGPQPHPRFPVFWADTPDISFLVSQGKLRRLLTEAGFCELVWEDETRRSIDAAIVQRGNAAPSAVGLSAVVGEEFELKAANTLRNLKEGRIVAAQAVFQRSKQ